MDSIENNSMVLRFATNNRRNLAKIKLNCLVYLTKTGIAQVLTSKRKASDRDNL